VPRVIFTVLIDISAEYIYPFHNLLEDVSDYQCLSTLATTSPPVVDTFLFGGFDKRMEVRKYPEPVSAPCIHMLPIFIVQCVNSLDPKVDLAKAN
jgi:hypothetical protein